MHPLILCCPWVACPGACVRTALLGRWVCSRDWVCRSPAAHATSTSTHISGCGARGACWQGQGSPGKLCTHSGHPHPAPAQPCFELSNKITPVHEASLGGNNKLTHNLEAEEPFLLMAASVIPSSGLSCPVSRLFTIYRALQILNSMLGCN